MQKTEKYHPWCRPTVALRTPQLTLYPKQLKLPATLDLFLSSPQLLPHTSKSSITAAHRHSTHHSAGALLALLCFMLSCDSSPHSSLNICRLPMESELADQQTRVEDLVAALDRLLVVPSDASSVRELVAGSPPRQWDDSDASGIDSLRYSTTTGSSPIGSPSGAAYYQRHTPARGKSTVPGSGGRGGLRGVRHTPVSDSVRVGHVFSSPDCVPSTVVASLPYRPSFYSSQFRAETREALGPTVLQFQNVAAEVAAPALLGDNSAQVRSAAVSTVDKREAAATYDALVQQRQEFRKLEELREEMRREAGRLTSLAQRVRAEHAQVQRRADAVTVREREVKAREQALQASALQWKEDVRRVKHQHMNSMRVASAVNRQLHSELSRCTIHHAGGDDVSFQSADVFDR